MPLAVGVRLALAELDEAVRIRRTIGGDFTFDLRDRHLRVLALRRLGRTEEAAVARASALTELEQAAARIDTAELRASFLALPPHAALLADADDLEALEHA